MRRIKHSVFLLGPMISRVIFLILLNFLSMGIPLTLAGQTTYLAQDVFTVANIYVDVTDKTASVARKKALAIGEKKAFEILLKRLTLRIDHDSLPVVDPKEISTYVKDFGITHEKNSEIRYLAYLTYRFKPNDIRFLLRDNDARMNSWQLPIQAFVLSGLLTMAFYMPILSQVVDYFVNKPSGMEELSTHAWALAEALRSLEIGFGGGTFLLAGGLITLVGVGSFYKRNKLALAIFISSILVTFLVAFFARGTMYPRFFFFLAGFFILIGVRGVMVTTSFCAKFFFPRNQHHKVVQQLPLLVMLVIILVSAFSMLRNYQYPKMNFEGAIEWLETEVGQSGIIVTAGVAAWPYRVYYGVDWPEVKTAEDIDRLKSPDSQLWMVYTFRRYMQQSAPEVSAIIERSCTEQKRFHGTLGGGDIVVCRLDFVDKRS